MKAKAVDVNQGWILDANNSGWVKKAGTSSEIKVDLGMPPSAGVPSSRQVGGAHYKDFAIQPSEFCQKNRLPWCESNVVKYVCRHRAKNGRQDIEKAIHYLQLILEWEYPEEG